MNIFILDHIATEAAKCLCDEHIDDHPNKVVNILSQALISKSSTNNHVQWCILSKQNFEWMLEFGFTICKIYTAIRLKNNPYKDDLLKIEKAFKKSKDFPSIGITKRTWTVLKGYGSLGCIESYRELYRTKYSNRIYSYRSKPKWLMN